MSCVYCVIVQYYIIEVLSVSAACLFNWFSVFSFLSCFRKIFTVCILGLDGICVECNNTYNNYMLRLSEIPGSWYLYLKVEQYFFIHLLNYLCFTLSKLSTYNCHYFSYNCLYQTLKYSPFQTFYQLSQYLSWTWY